MLRKLNFTTFSKRTLKCDNIYKSCAYGCYIGEHDCLILKVLVYFKVDI